MLKIKELPVGMIIWNKSNILGITGATLPKQYYEYYCTKIFGNEFVFDNRVGIIVILGKRTKRHKITALKCVN